MVCNKCDPDGTYKKEPMIMPEILPNEIPLIKETKCKFCGEIFQEPIDNDSM